MVSHKPLAKARGMCRKVAPEMTVDKKALAIKSYQLFFSNMDIWSAIKDVLQACLLAVFVDLLSSKLLKDVEDRQNH